MKVNQIFKYITFVLLGIISISSCTDKVDFGEQYKKIIYMVNSNGLLYQAEHDFNEGNSAVFSIYCASSKPITKDVVIQLKFDPHALDSLNTVRIRSDPQYTDRELLPEDHYELPSNLSVTIKAGNQYGTIAVPIYTDGLDPFKHYALPLTIVSNIASYDINPQLRSIVYEPVLVNGYSGIYSGISAESETIARTVQPTLKALSANTVLMSIHNLSSDIELLDNNFMVLTIAADSSSVSIAPHGNAKVIDLGGSRYDSTLQHFELNYQYIDGTGKTFTIQENISNVNAPVNDDELL